MHLEIMETANTAKRTKNSGGGHGRTWEYLVHHSMEGMKVRKA